MNVSICIQKYIGKSTHIFRVLEFRCEESKEEQKKEEKKEYGNDDPITQCPLVDSHEENGWSVRCVAFSHQEMKDETQSYI